ncbi:MAG: chromate transporter [Oscillospiraceae bacterium]|nr:chromate transporter [Oscillospiraceae bacterium]
MKELFELFFTFAKIGFFTFGGGYAMLPMLSRIVAEDKKWANEEELLNFYAIAQCTPGLIAVNTATFIGAKQKGVAGAVFATLGLILPGVLIMTLIAAFLHNFGSSEIVRNAFSGIKIAACALVTVSAFKLARQSVTGIITGLIAASSFIGVAIFGISPVLIIPVVAVLGVGKAIISHRKGLS